MSHLQQENTSGWCTLAHLISAVSEVEGNFDIFHFHGAEDRLAPTHTLVAHQRLHCDNLPLPRRNVCLAHLQVPGDVHELKSPQFFSRV